MAVLSESQYNELLGDLVSQDTERTSVPQLQYDLQGDRVIRAARRVQRRPDNSTQNEKRSRHLTSVNPIEGSRRRGIKPQNKLFIVNELISEALMLIHAVPSSASDRILSRKRRIRHHRLMERANKASVTALLDASQILLRGFWLPHPIPTSPFIRSISSSMTATSHMMVSRVVQ